MKTGLESTDWKARTGKHGLESQLVRVRSAKPAILPRLRYRQGRLLGRTEMLGLSLKNEVVLQTLTSDVLKTSEIENEYFDALSPEDTAS